MCNFSFVDYLIVLVYLIPAAKGRVIDATLAADLKAKLIVEAANDPTTSEGDAVLYQRGIPVIPDFLANSGGVVASYIEWRQAKSGSLTDKKETYEFVERQITRAFEQVWRLQLRRTSVSGRRRRYLLLPR